MNQPLPSQFQPRQILCLEHEQSRLYAEVIQVVSDRPVCWLRPLILEINPSNTVENVADDVAPDNNSPNLPSPREKALSIETAQSPPKTYDLRLSADLLMPPALFRPALDTELIPLLGQINVGEFSLQDARVAHQLLRQFIHQVCQNHQEIFPI